ncbi:MAG: HDOD domain-containing protein [Gammaproteobacteria bacterium]|nr:HDOD domain-containing protein [Gammaproteobacteria bacterium]MDH5652189.1 HDOD domain-containing protein [Gammaproteobacteria bacterium]
MQQSMADWIKDLGDTPIPVLPNTITALTKLCRGNDIPMHDIIDVVETDPGLTVQLIRTCSTSSHSRLRAEVTSAQQAAMMLGVEKLKKLPATLPDIKKALNETGRQHLLSVFARAYHAGRQAKAWAVLRRDMMPDEVFAAALLHFIGEMMIAMVAPDVLDSIYRMRDEEHIASEEAQYIVLGFTFDQLSLEIAEHWTLPSLVIEALRAENANHPRAYSIMLAVQLARHAAFCWYDRKMFQLQETAAEWLNQPLSKLIRDTHLFAVEVARDSSFYGVNPAAARLLADPVSDVSPAEQKPNHTTGICLIPQLAVLRDTIQTLKNLPSTPQALQTIITPTLHGLHDGIGLNRVVFSLFQPDEKIFIAFQIVGADNDPSFGQFRIDVTQPNLFNHLMPKTQSVWLNDSNREKLQSLIPEDFQNTIKTDSFYAMSVQLHNQVFGIFYADRHTTDCALEPISFKYFKALCMQAETTLQRISDIRIR